MAASNILPAGTVAHWKSLLHDVYVIERGEIRYLCFMVDDQLHIESALDLSAPTRLLPIYTEIMAFALLYSETPSSICLLGLGGGSLIRAFAEVLPTVKFCCVEYDTTIANAWRCYFAPKTTHHAEVHVSDALEFVADRGRNDQDIIFIDLFSGSTPPCYLETDTFLGAIKGMLTKSGGVAVFNILPGMDLDSVKNKLSKFFSIVDGVSAGSNFVLFAYSGDLGIEELKRRLAASVFLGALGASSTFIEEISRSRT